MLILLIGCVLLTVGVATLVDLSPLVASLAVGATMANLSAKSRALFDALARTDPPLYVIFFVLAGADTIVPPKFQREVVNAYAGPKRLVVLQGADHNDPLAEGAERELAKAMDWLLT